MWRRIVLTLMAAACPIAAMAQLQLRPDIVAPKLEGFRPLPDADAQLSSDVARLVAECKLDMRVPANKNPDHIEGCSSICVVDMTDLAHPVVGAWEDKRFIYPASSYKMYVLGEAVRQICAGERKLDDMTTVAAHNCRSDSKLKAGQMVPLSEIMRLMCTYSDNCAANVLIDTVDRQRASALLRAMGCTGSDITRKYLPRTREDEGYTTVTATESNAHAFATFLWATETGAIGGGRGRGLIKAYLAHNVVAGERFRAGLPPSATIYSKNGEWSIFTSEVGIVEDGDQRYILCVLTPYHIDIAAPRIAEFAGKVHALLKARRRAK